MMVHQREPNRQLEQLLSEAHFSRKGLARRVAKLATGEGLSVRCDHTSVGRWLAGSVPRDPTPALLAQVFSERVGRMVTSRDLGMDAVSEDQTVGLRYPKTVHDAVDTASLLWRYDVERREFLIGSAFAAGAVSAASRDWLIGNSRKELGYEGGTAFVSMSDVEQVRALGDEFERMSHTFGSQKIRRYMVDYLSHEVGPLLKQTRTEKVGRNYSM